MTADIDLVKAITTILDGSLEYVKRLLSGLENVNTILVPQDGYTALHLAANSGDPEKVRAVLQRNPNLEIHSRNKKFTPLHTAVINDHTAAASVLLDAGADIEATTNDELHAIHLAAMRGHANVTKVLLQRGANVHAIDVGGATALHAAAYYGFTEVARTLLDAGADPNRKDRHGFTPLTLARQKGHSALLSLLENPAQAANIHNAVEWGGKKDTLAAQIPTFKELSDAVENGQIDFIKNVVGSGQKLAGIVSPTGHTLLHVAAMYDRADLVPILIEAGVPKSQKDSLALETPLHTAVKNNRLGVARSLLASGADINARNINQWTPLHDAAYNGNIPMIELLLKYRADINATEMTDNTPTAVAVLNEQMAAARFLRGLGGYTRIWHEVWNEYAPKDYYPLLAKAVQGLKTNTPEMRRTVYDRARQILADHLRAAKVPEAEAEKSSMEIAIDRIETEHS